ncbi:putative PPE family protein PPE29 [Mycobacterium basiliense]|uniref:Putative PPE family protein PPE29 n=1 Tax=Mycobacterium basiliense TaxID=2094119 RepID=A0A3S4FR40_9MYCO|nr:PPE family protein [Mycobacterium basiliense]VDM88907.1 putative PPE family protein PPE29 [Mycobacterium basiliense]
MDFGALPPEINSLRMYSGPGSEPMAAAVTAWDGLAAELRATAASYETVISVLTSDGWLGPASEAMEAAIFPYLTWMTITGMQAEQTARQAAAAAGAFESAFAMTVPPAEVAANRALLTALVATNLIGQNTPAIAATEAAYGEMWAQDAAAMYGYATSSATAAALTPFTEPAQTTNPSGQASQATAVIQAAGTATGNLAQTELPALMSAVPASLQGLASPAASPIDAIPGAGLLADILNFLDGNDGNPYGIFLNSNLTNGFVSAGYVNPAVVGPAVWAAMADINAVALGAEEGAAVPPMGSGEGNATWLPPVSPANPESLPILGEETAARLAGGGVSAGTNQAALVGRMSVPQTWIEATAVANHAGAAAPGGGWTSTAAVPEAAAVVPGMPGMPAPGIYGHGFGNAPRYGFRPTIMGRPPAAG